MFKAFNVGVSEFIPSVATTNLCNLLSLAIALGDVFLAFVDILSHWLLFIPLVYFLGITLNMGYWGAWIGFASHLTFIAAFTIFRLKSGKWKEVIL